MSNEPDFTVEEVLRVLRPLSAGGKTDCFIWFWGDGDIHVDCTMRGGTKLKGTGTSLRAAVAALGRDSIAISEAIGTLRPARAEDEEPAAPARRSRWWFA